MWWLRNLQYSIVGKILMLTVAIVVVSGFGLVGYYMYNKMAGGELEPIVATETAEEATIRKAKTGRELRCEAAKGRLQRLVEQTGRFTNMNMAQNNSAFETYARAVRTCTYNEFAEFEREILIPWSSGQDMLTAAQERGVFDAPVASTVPEATK
jgi:glutamate dehydrogenase/leucine dehydrogenase